MDINECETAGGNDVCGVQQGAGTCRNEANRFACDCNAGYRLAVPMNTSSACGKSFYDFVPLNSKLLRYLGFAMPVNCEGFVDVPFICKIASIKSVDYIL